MSRQQKIVTSVLLADFCFGLQALMKQAAIWEGTTVQGLKVGSIQQPARH
jgi:hypothetical protein